MRVSAENYTPQALLPKLRRQAWTTWSVAFLIVFAWVFSILIAPVIQAEGFTAVSAPVYKFFSYLCHQQPERSFHIAEYPFAVCSRCFGVYSGLLLGFIIYPFIKKIEEIEPLPRIWLFLAMVPIGIDWSLGIFGIWENTHVSRFITGAILGAACAVFIVPALVELFRLLSGKNQSKRLSR
jgi:uncharacterized membrane protein